MFKKGEWLKEREQRNLVRDKNDRKALETHGVNGKKYNDFTSSSPTPQFSQGRKPKMIKTRGYYSHNIPWNRYLVILSKAGVLVVTVIFFFSF